LLAGALVASIAVGAAISHPSSPAAMGGMLQNPNSRQMMRPAE
jgi:hypothetical protein